MFEACREKELNDGDGCGAGAGCNDLNVLFLLSDDLEGIDHACQCNDSRAVLVIVEDRDIASFFQFALDLEAAGSRNVLKVNSAEGTGDQSYGVNDLVNIF